MENKELVKEEKIKQGENPTETKAGKWAGRIIIIILLVLLFGILIAAGAVSIKSVIGVHTNEEFIETVGTSEVEDQLLPVIDENGYYTFITDDDFKILQLTDINLGASYDSEENDKLALNAISAMVLEESPDLVVVTGDITSPVGYDYEMRAGMFAELMEQLGVYWCPVLGNHDSRKKSVKIYSNEEYEHCLFQDGDENVDGNGNYVINVKNTAGEITQSLFMLDSNTYTYSSGKRIIGSKWDFDCVHNNQIQWYSDTLETLGTENGGIMPKSLVFLHMPMQEYRDAWREYKNHGYEDTEDVKYVYGTAGERYPVVYCSEDNYGLFDAALQLGSTQGFFCGHDKLNNFSIEYKGIRLTYGYSIDYLMYENISEYGMQRGCTVIKVHSDSTFDCNLENYYQDKYQPVMEKEEVLMDGYGYSNVQLCEMFHRIIVWGSFLSSH